MKAISLNRKSWHYWLATCRDTYSEHEDICSYTRAVVGSLLGLFLIVALAIALLVCAGFGLAWIVCVIAYLALVDPDPWGVFGAVIWLFVAIGCVGAAWHMHGPRVEMPFVKTAWRHFHDKTCARVTFK